MWNLITNRETGQAFYCIMIQLLQLLYFTEKYIISDNFIVRHSKNIQITIPIIEAIFLQQKINNNQRLLKSQIIKLCQFNAHKALSFLYLG